MRFNLNEPNAQFLFDMTKAIFIILSCPRRETFRKESRVIKHYLSVAVVNSLWSILTGEKLKHGDERVTTFGFQESKINTDMN